MIFLYTKQGTRTRISYIAIVKKKKHAWIRLRQEELSLRTSSSQVNCEITSSRKNIYINRHEIHLKY